MVLVYNVYKNCTANEFALNEKGVGSLFFSGFLNILSLIKAPLYYTAQVCDATMPHSSTLAGNKK